MDFRIVSLPPFRAATSGVDKEFDLSEAGILGRFDRYFSAITPSPRDNFMPRDFLFYDEEKKGMVWWWALSEGMDPGGNDVVDFDGGYYLTYVHRDGDEQANDRLYREALDHIAKSGFLDLDIRANHYAMGHIITPPEIIRAQGWAQMEAFIPVRLKRPS
jgi:hypothetical protein